MKSMELTTQIVSAYVAHNQVPLAEVAGFINQVHKALEGEASGMPAGTQKPAVPIKKSVFDDRIICLEDGKALKMLKRYLRSHYDLTPEQYRAKWGLPSDYPMVAPAYARKRSEFAKAIGLGRVSSATPKKKR